jgi:hypothetical protein
MVSKIPLPGKCQGMFKIRKDVLLKGAGKECCRSLQPMHVGLLDVRIGKLIPCEGRCDSIPLQSRQKSTNRPATSFLWNQIPGQ